MAIKKRKYYADVKPDTEIPCRKCDIGTMKLGFWYVDAGQAECSNPDCRYRVEKRRADGHIDTFGWFPRSQGEKFDPLITKYDKLDPYGVLESN